MRRADAAGRCCTLRPYTLYTASTQIEALEEIVYLTVSFRSVREMFVNVGASSALHFISFEAKHLGDENAEVSKIMALADEMRLCLEENEVYAVCRKSFLSPSWAHEHEGAELRLELEPYLSLASIALKYIHLLELDTFTFGGFMAYSKQIVHKESVIVRYGRKDADTIGRTCTILVKYATKSVSSKT
ncbi:hypothetical protein DFH11DRAFT_260842 [Phellopilus nigrolimitatus]|nr:hypothetical protein DFH11DRAFT_260842 [Phellopilus nigrolimitatus]